MNCKPNSVPAGSDDGMGESRLIVVGLDSASPKLVTKWRSQLPNISSVIREGVSGVLWSSHPPITCPAWSCFSTGKNPGKFGVYDFLNLMEDGTTRVYDSTMQDSPDVWEIISAHGKTVGVYNVPTTYPPRRVNGFLVSGFLAPLSSRDYAYPKELVKELDRLTGHYELDLPLDYADYVKGGKEAFLREIQRLHRQQETATLHLMRKFRWDFFMVVFTLLDAVQHQFYDERDPSKMGVILQSYKLADETLGNILKEIDKDTSVLIASDHGAHQASSVFFANGWLRRKGYLEFGRSSKTPSISEALWPMVRRIVQRHFRPTTISALLRHLPLRLQGRTTHQRWLKRSVDSRLELIDWTRTRAFALGSVGPCGRIYLNKQDSALRQGCELLKAELKSKILQISESLRLVQPGNVTVDIMDKERVYWGKYAHLAPDLIFYIYVDGKACDISAAFTDQLWGQPDRLGSHQPDGFWALRGQNVSRGRVLDAKITDMAPTILHALGIPIPADMDGTVVKEAFVNWISTLQPPVTVPKQEFAYTPEEQEEILRRLHRLGYV